MRGFSGDDMRNIVLIGEEKYRLCNALILSDRIKQSSEKI